MKKRMIQLITGAAAYLICLVVFELIKIDIEWLRLACYALAFLILGYNVLYKAVRNIFRGKIFDENFLMTIASVGAFIISEYPEAAAVMLFYQAGELFQAMAVGKSRKSIAELMNIRPDYANVAIDQSGAHMHFTAQTVGVNQNMPLNSAASLTYTKEDITQQIACENQSDALNYSQNNHVNDEGFLSAKTAKKSPDEVNIGDIIIIKPGEKIPLDGTVIAGSSTLDTSALSGESRPRTVKQGDSVLSGSINLSGVLAVCATKSFGESTASKILQLVENASGKKSKSEGFITRFARVYTPAVVILAAILAIFPPLLFKQEFSVWIFRALTFLVVSCPCALVVSVPMSFFGGIGGASKCGILIKGGNYLEALAKVETVVFDKTGTLTQGSFMVSEICAIGINNANLINVAAHAESYSNHPISLSLRQEFTRMFGDEINKNRVSDYQEVSGHGIVAKVDEIEVLAGNQRLLDKYGIATNIKSNNQQSNQGEGTVVYIAIGGIYKGYILIADQIKPDSHTAIAQLKRAKIGTAMLTGDRDSVGKSVAAALKIDNVYTELLPQDKVTIIEQIIAGKSKNRTVAFVGDGINDAPVLARADVGIAMGGLGSDAAIEAADVVIMNDSPSKIAQGIKIAKKTVTIATQNILFAIGIKAVVLFLSVFGLTSMWLAVFADVGVAFIAILNAMRCLKVKRPKNHFSDLDNI